MRSCSAFALRWLLLAALPGCASWQKSDRQFRLPPPQVAADSIACEVAFVQWDSRARERDERFWESTDEQFLPVDVRQRLEENGIRVALLSGQLPAGITDRLSETRDMAAALIAQKLPRGAEMLYRRETRQCRPGIAERIEVLPENAQRGVILLSEDGRVKARERDRMRGFITLTARPHSDGRLRVEFIPGIEYGELRQSVTGNAAGLRYELKRDQELFDKLAFTAAVSHGQTLIFSSTPEPRGIGATFFANRFEDRGDQLFLLIRIARQGDDLFASSDQLEPLVTPTE